MDSTYRHRLLMASVLAGVGLAVAACNGGGTAAQAPATVTVAGDETAAETPAEETDGAAVSVGEDGAEAGVNLPADWPDDDFPIPPGVTITGGKDANGVGIVLAGKDPNVVADFYRSALPTAGYEIVNDSSVGVGGVQVVGMEFRGNGYDGDLAVVNNTVSISLKKI
jgi:hypothetical protein